jgi:hypothetical protein
MATRRCDEDGELIPFDVPAHCAVNDPVHMTLDVQDPQQHRNQGRPLVECAAPLFLLATNAREADHAPLAEKQRHANSHWMRHTHMPLTPSGLRSPPAASFGLNHSDLSAQRRGQTRTTDRPRICYAEVSNDPAGLPIS